MSLVATVVFATAVSQPISAFPFTYAQKQEDGQSAVFLLKSPNSSPIRIGFGHDPIICPGGKYMAYVVTDGKTDQRITVTETESQKLVRNFVIDGAMAFGAPSFNRTGREVMFEVQKKDGNEILRGDLMQDRQPINVMTMGNSPAPVAFPTYAKLSTSVIFQLDRQWQEIDFSTNKFSTLDWKTWLGGLPSNTKITRIAPCPTNGLITAYSADIPANPPFSAVFIYDSTKGESVRVSPIGSQAHTPVWAQDNISLSLMVKEQSATDFAPYLVRFDGKNLVKVGR
ncbi:MAG: hypothetical protein KDC26_02685 [Armatimonadetes bacterium]|nr:hypothetical protein [Armatimonadota bacterium]